MTIMIKNVTPKGEKIFDKFLKNKSVLILLIFLLSFTFEKVCFATMAASGPALNEKTKQCGYFYGGDENKLYDIPSGWEVDFQSQKVREKFERCGWYSGKANIKECCEKLGYDVIEDVTEDVTEDDIGIIGSRSGVTYLVTVVLFFLVLIIFLAKKRTGKKQS